jgi:hypothetical protein
MFMHARREVLCAHFPNDITQIMNQNHGWLFAPLNSCELIAFRLKICEFFCIPLPYREYNIYCITESNNWCYIKCPYIITATILGSITF